ncbi:hypothetical protein PTSG_13208 [Salpingoeca rosetta]|uniref:Uncharacterized protein n=1 Tax=Salpingoeca rosetta (strain ATCC 50818 / BSB-021) TaxID=946362 RepID=F2UTK8_SALR5|nr:uncharacterized protein PTSG_13208 [Salpingoeca rosetta]EGD72981.1 hypothetical protein PTSG_13208 [Salpingoeca rosetta]|eukprot:XP_004987496.1 hypothetical protein PTSG_13208 [Salpingoeca rosetta]
MNLQQIMRPSSISADGIKVFAGAEQDANLFFITVEAKLIAAGIDAGIIAEGGADHQGDGQAPAAASSPSPSTHGASGPRTRSRAQRGPRRTGARHDVADHDDDDDEGDGDDHGAQPSSSSSSLPSSATPSGGAQVASRASGLLDPRDPQVDAAIFAFLLGVLTGHPLRLAITDNRGRSGVLALRRLRERYIRSGKDHVSRLRQQLSSTTWLPTDTVDTFMSRITDINSQLLAAGVSIPEDDLRTLVRNELPAEFDVAMRFMEREDPPPSLSKMTADLIQEERRLHRPKKRTPVLAIGGPGPGSFAASPMHAGTSPSDTSGGPCCPPAERVTCAFCNFRGHCAQQCRKLQAAKRYHVIDVRQILATLRNHGNGNGKRPGSSRPQHGRAAPFKKAAVVSHGPQRVETFAIHHDALMLQPEGEEEGHAIGPIPPQLWLADSGATAHITSDASLLTNYIAVTQHVTVANNQTVTVIGKGDAMLRCCHITEPATVKERLPRQTLRSGAKPSWTSLRQCRPNDVYDVVPRADLPKGHKLLRSMVIFRKKRDDQGKVIKYKARWVAKGYSQVHGVNYTDTFAPTATIAAIRTMLAMAVARGMNVQQMDVNTAFLNAPVDHEIYVQPPAVDGIFSPNTVLRLKRGLYGLKQSPRLWNHTLDAWMREQDFVATATDACIYRRTCKGGKVMWVAVYVDDLLIFADSDMAAFKKAISKRFKMKDLGSPDICLGIKVQHDRKARTVTMSQEHYLRSVLETFGMADCKPVGTPLCTGYVDKPADKEEPLPDVPFRELLGSLLYAATMTRPDISAAVSILSRRMQHFGMDHWKAAKHLLRYIKGTLSYTIKYAATGDTSNGSTVDGVLSAYSDASFASDVDTRRSRTGFVVFCSTGPVSWNSKLQATVATASADAEYMALAATAQELMFLRQLQEELTGAVLCEPTLVHTDNQPAQRVAEHAASRMRHILVKYHYIRECVDTKRIVLSYLATEHMIADLLTKILPRPKTAQFCTMLFDQRPLPGCQPRARPHSGRSPRPSTPRQDL